jgi:hypothetical protein
MPECPHPDCDHDAPSRDHLVDHLTDKHDAFTQTTNGWSAFEA